MDTDTRKLDAVFEGGGVKGIGLVGALTVIEEQGYELARIAGTSAGAIVAALYAAGYTAAEIKNVIVGLDLTMLTDVNLVGPIPSAGQAIDVMMQLGMYEGDAFLALIRKLLAAKGVHTFRDLLLPGAEPDDPNRFKVHIIASDVTRGMMLVLPLDLTNYGLIPDDFEVALAVRMSMSIPFFFKPVRLRSADGETSYIVDGTLLSDYPVWLFDEPGEPEWPTFGLRLVASGPPTIVRRTIQDPLSILMALFGAAAEAHDARYIETCNFARTIAIDTLGISSTDFDIAPVQKEALYQAGIDAAHSFLATWDFERYKALYRSGRTLLSRREQALPTMGQPSAQSPV